MSKKSLALVVDMYGCPNRCRHCWLGHMPNRSMEEGDDQWIVDYFRPYFDRITYYSWLREPDYCSDYQKRWERDKAISIGTLPKRFELASFWRLVRDPEYVLFLKREKVEVVQLTFFGLEEMTDQYVGRKGAFGELLQATEILLKHQIAPRWQAFIYEENKDELVELLKLSKELRLEKRCGEFGAEFQFFVHTGSCDGENRKQYPIWINKENIPKELIPYFINYETLLTEKECYQLLRDDLTHRVHHYEEEIVLQITNTYDVYYNVTHMSEEWKIGNLKQDDKAELIRWILEEDIPAFHLAKSISLKELAARYADPKSHKAFQIGDYKDYLVNCYVQECFFKGS